MKFGRNGGGHKPNDLWASIINRDSEAFSKFPQVYAIASENGVEVGFSVTIHEDDYYNQTVKRKNRSIVPVINAKLPSPSSEVVTNIDKVLSSETGWIFARKTRQGSASSFANIEDLIAHLKSGTSSAKGGGAIYRILDFEEVAAADNRLEQEISHVLALFRPIMRMLQPTYDEARFVDNLIEVADQAEEIDAFDPASDDEGKRRILKEIAIRQGQAKFRTQLLDAYQGKCAITGCALEPTLQAAHISPWNGAKSNHVSNGILLRADIHTLFDLGLLKIDPITRSVIVTAGLSDTEYAAYAGLKIVNPVKPAHRPSQAALQKKLDMFPAE